LPDKFLIVDASDLIEQISLPSRRKVGMFNVAKTFSESSCADELCSRARTTLTKKVSNLILLNASRL